MAENTATRTPSKLGPKGRNLWKSMVDRVAFEPHELVQLEMICRTVDRIHLIEDELHGQPLMIDGSMGQMVAHPLIGEVRAQNGHLSTLISRLGVPVDDDEAKQDKAARSSSARTLAEARWKRGA